MDITIGKYQILTRSNVLGRHWRLDSEGMQRNALPEGTGSDLLSTTFLSFSVCRGIDEAQKTTNQPSRVFNAYYCETKGCCVGLHVRKMPIADRTFWGYVSSFHLIALTKSVESSDPNFNQTCQIWWPRPRGIRNQKPETRVDHSRSFETLW